jgi:SAM-dependent methyltransferase
MADTAQAMERLRKRGVALSPYLELGAERGQRALVLENDFGARGAAVDLSLDMLRSTAHYGEVFHKPRMPERICCDAHTLPFRTGSLPFVFCYEFLHHFPTPAPVVKEIHRVLAPGGWFFFD